MVREASKDSLARTAPDGDEAGCSTLAVVSTGQAWSTPIAELGQAPSKQPTWERQTDVPPLINSARDKPNDAELSA